MRRKKVTNFVHWISTLKPIDFTQGDFSKGRSPCYNCHKCPASRHCDKVYMRDGEVFCNSEWIKWCNKEYTDGSGK